MREIEFVMRVREGSKQSNGAPRYRALAQEEAARHAAHEDRRAEAARTEAAKFFYDLRRGLRLARVAVANRLGTEPDVIEALETGSLDSLPPWQEIVRIVTGYTHMVALDPRPVLNALHFALSNHYRQLAGQSWLQKARRKAAGWPANFDQPRQNRPYALTWAAGLSLPIVLVLSFMITSGLHASQMPQPLVSMFGLDKKAQAETEKKLEGLVWIDVADPRERRGDKLR